jgi:hypothetical protein
MKPGLMIFPRWLSFALHLKLLSMPMKKHMSPYRGNIPENFYAGQQLNLSERSFCHIKWL